MSDETPGERRDTSVDPLDELSIEALTRARAEAMARWTRRRRRTVAIVLVTVACLALVGALALPWQAPNSAGTPSLRAGAPQAVAHLVAASLVIWRQTLLDDVDAIAEQLDRTDPSVPLPEAVERYLGSWRTERRASRAGSPHR